MTDTATLLAYAREIQAGDVLGDKTVKSVSHDDGKVTVTFKGGGTGEFAPDDEVQVGRGEPDGDLPAGWLRDGDAIGTPEALELLAAARKDSDTPEVEA